jgi:hypothetical protein
MVEAKRVDPQNVDALISDFRTFAGSCSQNKEFRSFSKNDNRLDTLYFENVSTQYPALWEVLKCILLLSHGQAAIERGFSVNKTVSTDNQLADSLVKLRLVKDHINSVGGIKHVIVGQELLSSCSSARKKYMDDLERKREEEKRAQRQNKRKLHVEEVVKVKKLCKEMSDDITNLTQNAEKLYDKAEKTRQISFVTAGNAIRRGISDKESELKQLQVELKEREEALSNM